MWSYLVLLPWAALLLFWGRFWLAGQRLPDRPPPVAWPAIAIIIPARDEAGTIAEVVRAHRASTYPGPVRLLVVDDASSDGTGAIARQAGAEVIETTPLPEGWSGKLWAVESGVRHALSESDGIEWILLTDADIVHAPDTMARLVAFGEADNLALVSLMARLDDRGLWGALLIPAFVFFFQKLYPFYWVNQPGHRCAAAAGGCMLVRRETLEGAGGIGAIRGALIDDCALAEAIKHGNPKQPIFLGLSEGEVTSRRDNRALGSIWTMVARTAFTQLRHSVWLLVASVLGMAVLYLAPVALTVVGFWTGDTPAFTAGALAWAAMTLAYTPTLRLYGRPFLLGLFLPLSAGLYMAMTISSAVRHFRGQGGFWKGRTYS